MTREYVYDSNGNFIGVLKKGPPEPDSDDGCGCGCLTIIIIGIIFGLLGRALF